MAARWRLRPAERRPANNFSVRRENSLDSSLAPGKSNSNVIPLLEKSAWTQGGCVIRTRRVARPHTLRAYSHDRSYKGELRSAHAVRCSRCCEEWLLSSNFIDNLQHMVHDHISVLQRKHSCDYLHCFAMSFLTSSNGRLVFINSHENPLFKHIDIFIARELIWIYSPVHVMACDPRPNRYVFRVSFENVVRPVTMAIPECAHGVGRTQAA